MRKAQALNHWRSIEAQPIRKPTPIPYKHSGTTYGADGVRIEGSPAFVDSILAQLKPLLDGENCNTRLALVYQDIEARPGKENDYVGNTVCYIKTHERGGQAQAMNAIFGQIN